MMSDLNYMEIGQRIRNKRELLGYTREQFSEKLDVTPKFCSDIELGVKGMSLQTLCKISKVLHLSTDTILFGRTNEEPSTALEELVALCPMEKRPYAEEILKNFLLALD